MIAAGILTAAATAGAYFLNWWPIIGRFMKRAWDFVLSTAPVPIWLLGLLGILSLPVLFFAFALIWNRFNPSQMSVSDWRAYREDVFFGLRWRWRYFDDGKLHNVVTFCAHCDFQVFPYQASPFRALDRIGFRCDSCGRNLGEFDESFQSLESKVERFVQQKIRNGTWDKGNMV